MNTDIGNGKKKRIEYEFCCDGCEFANGNFLECVESNVMFCKRTLKQHDKQIRAEVLDKLFNTEIRSGMTLKEVYEEAPINEFDGGWNRCYEDFAEVAEQLKEEAHG